MSIDLHPLAAMPDPSAPPLQAFLPGTNRPYLIFGNGVQESAVWTFRIPSVTTPVVAVQWSADSGTPSGQTLTWRVNVMAVTPDASEDVHADSYAGNNDQGDTFVGASIGFLQETAITLSTLPAGIAIGDYVALRLSRLSTGTLSAPVRYHAGVLELG